MTNSAAPAGPRQRARWVAPVAVLGLALAIPALAQTSAQADPPLPTITAEKLIEEVIASEPVAMQGEFTQTMDLGLPEIPGGVQKPSSLEPLNLAQGTHTWRVWYDGGRSARLALVDGTSEAALITNPTDTWAWSSLDREAIHTSTPAGATPREELTVTPAEAAKKLLSTADESTAVTVAGTTTVAGHAAYDLTLTPKATTTLVKKVSIAIEATTKQPLRVQVFSARQSDPAVSIGFTSLSFTQPDPSMFTFTPPPGATVTEKSDLEEPSTDEGEEPAQPTDEPTATPGGPSGEPTVTGTGWGSVIVAEGMGDLTGLPSGIEGLLEGLPRVTGDWGSGRLFQGTLFTVVVTDEGRVAAGAVPAEQLYAALA